MTLPLEGYKVLDLTFWVFAPSTAVVLGDWGADVIHVEPVEGGDPMRGLMSAGVLGFAPIDYPFDLDNRNKRSLAIDLKKPKGRDILYKLVETADVFLTNYRLTALKKLGITYEEISQINPKIIYAHASGYGEQGPEAERGGYDYGAYWARSGLMSSLGEPDDPPPPQRAALGDQISGLVFAGGIAVALLARERFGIGQKVADSLLANALWQGAFQAQAVLSGDPNVSRVSRKTAGNPLVNSYRCRDGKWLQLICLQPDRYWPGLCRAIDRPDLEHDPRFETMEVRNRNNVEMIRILDEVLATRPRDEWGRLFDEYGVLWAPVQDYYEVVKDPMVVANNYIVEVDHPRWGKTKWLMSPIQFSQTPASIRRVAPTLGQHNEEILLELGYGWEEIVQFKDEGVIL
ncbi:MAG TPA: CoA transferase [Dehalococcoidia bacterium]|nr:CoA transferase [Dehalococcoidia bacterium]